MDARASFGDGFPPGLHRVRGVTVWGLQRRIVVWVAVVVGRGGGGGAAVEVEVHGSGRGGGEKEIGKGSASPKEILSGLVISLLERAPLHFTGFFRLS